MSKFGKEVKELCAKVGMAKDVSKVSTWLKENAWKVAFTFSTSWY